MLSYILEVSICWGAFYLLYWLLLSRETFFHFNRWYLVGTLLASLVIPAVEWQLPQRVAESEIATVYFQPITIGVETLEVTVTATAITSGIGVLDVLTGLYWAGMVFCMLRFLVGMRQIYRLYHRSEKRYRNGYQIILSEKAHPPFSFFNSLFISKSIELDADDREAILRHELAHIRGGHSIDIILLEVLNAVFWCSPFIYLYRRSLRNVHEYIADAAVLRTTQRKQYGHLLIRQSQSGPAIAIANHFHSQLKKRILMMMRNPSKRRAMLQYLLVLPLTLLVLLVFSNADAKASMQQQAAELQQTIEEKLNANNTVTKISGENFTKFEVVNGEIHFETDGITLEMDTIPVVVDGKLFIDEIVNFEIHYPNGQVEQFSKKPNDIWADEKIKPENIEKVEVNKDKQLITIWLKGNYIVSPDFEIHYSDGEIERTKDQQKVNELIALDIVLSVEVTKPENLVKVNVSKPKNLIPKVDPNWLGKNSIQIGGENTILFQNEANGVPINGKISSATFYNANELQEPPLFPGCDEVADKEERRKCSDKEMLMFIYKNIKYPATAREQGISGNVVVGFIVDENGYVKNTQILRGIGGGCDEEVLRLVNQMPRWKPGVKDGKAISVQYSLPVNYKLEGKEIPNTLESDRDIIEQKKQKNPSQLEEITVVGYGTKKTDTATLPKEGEEVFKVVEEMPRFPGCEDMAGETDEKKACADKKMLEFVYQNIKYPKEAREKGIEGMAVVSFIVGKDGVIREPKIVRGIGGGCDEEVLRMANLMPKWIPGKQRARAVDVQFNLPVRFKLSEEDKQQKENALANSALPANTLQLQNFKASPNPTNGVLNLSFKGEKKPTLIKVFDLQGKEIQSLELKNFDGTFNERLDLSKAGKGVLIISILQGEQSYTEKIIVQ